ncbi:hypothetical protein CDAR_189801 [Caerostris darwini]|uniref:Uncharacterized protein n=1 Tax=Caerostris darwini TaxID=1538125 RepID=A0AAV4VLE0_9ARAC|nr:hypothetical protein CDAR_189801 [Caerostris darwini]
MGVPLEPSCTELSQVSLSPLNSPTIFQKLGLFLRLTSFLHLMLRIQLQPSLCPIQQLPRQTLINSTVGIIRVNINVSSNLEQQYERVFENLETGRELTLYEPLQALSIDYTYE